MAVVEVEPVGVARPKSGRDPEPAASDGVEELLVAVLTVAGNLDVAGNTTLGDEPTDTTTITGPTTGAESLP